MILRQLCLATGFALILGDLLSVLPAAAQTSPPFGAPGATSKSEPKLPKIWNVFVVEYQELLPYPFNSDGSESETARIQTDGGATTRHLIIHGENLKEAAAAGEALKSSSAAISYAFDPVPLEDDEGWFIDLRTSIDRALAGAVSAKKPIPSLVERLATLNAALEDIKRLVIVNVSLKPGVTPGSKQLILGKSGASWQLLFGN